MQKYLSYKKILICIVLFGSFVRFFRLRELFPFIGDYAWFYISARDMLLTGNIPLVGITSSHTWLHQGPLWTYLLAFVLWLSQFDPLSGGYFVAFVGIITIWMIFVVGKYMFSKKVALISSLLYATSPLVVIHSRIAYHTSFIPFFTLVFLFSLFQLVKGKKTFLPILTISLGILYNLELATVVFFVVVLSVIAYGIGKKQKWIKTVFTKKNNFYACIAFFIPLIPFFIYDIFHGFPQTLKFIAWIGYKTISFIIPINFSENNHTYKEISDFLIIHLTRLVFIPSAAVSLSLFFFSIFVLVNIIIKSHSEKKPVSSLVLLLLSIIVPIVGFVINKTPSEAYLLVFFPTVIFMIAILFEKTMRLKKFKYAVWIFIIFIAIWNSLFLIKNNYLMGTKIGYGPTMEQRVQAVENVITLAGKSTYSLQMKGKGSQFQSFEMPYTYLLWYKKRPPTENDAIHTIIIEEENDAIGVKKNLFK